MPVWNKLILVKSSILPETKVFALVSAETPFPKFNPSAETEWVASEIFPSFSEKFQVSLGFTMPKNLLNAPEE